jgi:hypothetical protein
MSREEMKSIYKGKWLFVVNMEGPFFADNGYGQITPCPFSAGELFVAADNPYEGREDGIYDDLKINRDEYGTIGELDFRTGLTLPFTMHPVGQGEYV